MKRRGGFLRVNNLSKYQHYEAKNPAWVKLYASVLDDYDFAQLPDDSKYHAIALIPLASRIENHVPDDSVWVGQKISAKSSVDLSLLVSIGFLRVCDCDSCSLKNPEKSCKNLDPEKRRDRVEGETEESAPSLRSGARSPKTRELDAMKEALAEAVGYRPADGNKSAWGPFQSAAKSLLAEGARPEDVPRVAKAYKREWPNVEMTVTALAKHWARFTRKRTNHGRQTDPRTEADLLLQEAWSHAREREDLDADELTAVSEALQQALNQDNPVDAVKAVKESYAL